MMPAALRQNSQNYTEFFLASSFTIQHSKFTIQAQRPFRGQKNEVSTPAKIRPVSKVRGSYRLSTLRG